MSGHGYLSQDYAGRFASARVFKAEEDTPKKMAHSRPSASAQLVRQVQAGIAAGKSVKESCADAGVSVPTYYRWRSAGAPKRQLSQDSEKFKLIMDAAAKLFLSEGWSVSVDRIAALSGLSRQTVFNNIGTKERLFRQVVASISSRLIDSLPELRVTDDLREALLTFARQYSIVAYDPEGIALYKLLISESRTFPDLARFAGTLGGMRAAPILSSFFKQRIAEGSLSPCDPDLTAESFLSSVIGRARWAVLLGGSMEPVPRREARLHNAVDLFVRSLTIQSKMTGDPSTGKRKRT